jgi:hypothetical protein
MFSAGVFSNRVRKETHLPPKWWFGVKRLSTRTVRKQTTQTIEYQSNRESCEATDRHAQHAIQRTGPYVRFAAEGDDDCGGERRSQGVIHVREMANQTAKGQRQCRVASDRRGRRADESADEIRRHALQRGFEGRMQFGLSHNDGRDRRPNRAWQMEQAETKQSYDR